MLIKSIKKHNLQAIERIISHENWITLVIVFAVILVAIMKLIKPNKLLGYSLAFLTPGFFQKKIQNNTPFYTPFHLLLFTFCTITISLFLFLVIFSENYERNFLAYLTTLALTSIYFLTRHFLDFSLAKILGLYNIIKYFTHSKSGYLYTLSLWLFPFIILYQYSYKNKLFLFSIFIILLLFRLFLILRNNKRLVISKLFYFILYFCTLEIAPLLVLFKATTTK
ncbi:MAG: DUF4271 domain-containing protein [Tenacibaculum sp.]